MAFENFENIFTLICTIVGMLYCVSRYIETPRRGYRLVIVFFLANFLSEYYWTVYELVMHAYPDVSEFVAYFGWNVGYLFLMFSTLHLRSDEAKRYFHPLMLLPLLTNIPQFFLYTSYGGLWNNCWEVGTTTVAMIFCLQGLLYHVKNKGTGKVFPWFSLLVMVHILANYGMWTSSCYDWGDDFQNPYLYCSILAAFSSLFFAYGVKRHYEIKEPGLKPVNIPDIRLKVLMQTVVTLVIVGICTAGFFTAYGIKNSMSGSGDAVRNERQIVISLFVISAILILLILFLVYVMTSHYRRIQSKRRNMNEGERSRVNFIFTVIVTLVLMVFAVAYNNVVLYNASVLSVYEDGEAEIKTTATDLENYLTVASTTLRVMADSVDLMKRNGGNIEEIRQYVMDQTKRQAELFDENFTGLYAFMDGEYLDGVGWEPPAGYDPTTRNWYKTAVAANGEVVIVSPYLDAQTGSVVITFAKSLQTAGDSEASTVDVVCLDVIVNYIQEVTQAVDIAGKGYGMVVNSDGFIIAHRDREKNGGSLSEVYGQGLLDGILATKGGSFNLMINGEKCTLFVAPVMDQWYSVIVIGSGELFEDTYSQLAVNIVVSLITFCLIAFFYYIGYKNEQVYGHRVEEMNLQVVSALAAAIDAKDNYTNGHSSRVADYARMIASRSGYSEPEQSEIYMMGLLHDVGKIGVPDEVINKNSKLTDSEYELIKKHPAIGGDILERIRERPELATGARWHHERYDGGGYPDGIAGEQIPEAARIIAVADAYDAMTSRRSYRDIMPQAKVLDEIKRGRGTQFDPRFADVMIKMIEEDTEYRMREEPSC